MVILFENWAGTGMTTATWERDRMRIKTYSCRRRVRSGETFRARSYTQFLNVFREPNIHSTRFAMLISDVTKLLKIRMRISTSKIRRIRMRIRMLLDKGLFYHSECNTLVYVRKVDVY